MVQESLHDGIISEIRMQLLETLYGDQASGKYSQNLDWGISKDTVAGATLNSCFIIGTMGGIAYCVNV